MADTMKFDLVSPERRVASMQVTSLRVPGAEGDMTAMPDHAPTHTTLRPGVVHAEGPDGSVDYVVTGGFAEIGPGAISVLAEESLPSEEVTQEVIDRMVEDAAKAHARANEQSDSDPGAVDDAAKLLADMVAMGENIGLSPKQPSL